MLNAQELIKELGKLADKKQAAVLQKFFKTGKGQYGEGDVFMGIKVPVLRKAIKAFQGLGFAEILKLLRSPIHEHRMSALFLLVHKFSQSTPEDKKIIFDLYLKNTRFINNWDLVDLSAIEIVGNFLLDQDKQVLFDLAQSEWLWDRRIAIISTFALIKRGRTEETYKLARILLNDKHDLMHKAVGWMLREAGKRVDADEERRFLEKVGSSMPRTMLRYAIEKFSLKERKRFLKMK